MHSVLARSRQLGLDATFGQAFDELALHCQEERHHRKDDNNCAGAGQGPISVKAVDEFVEAGGDRELVRGCG